MLPHGAWTVDDDASTVGFRIRHFGAAVVSGRFEHFTARVDEAGATGSVEVASVDTGQPIRDDRLRTELFDAEDFPRMTFRAREPIGATVHGDLTIREVTLPVRLDVSGKPAGDGRFGLHATATISRRAFGLRWSALVDAGRVLVSDRVEIELDLVLVPA